MNKGLNARTTVTYGNTLLHVAAIMGDIEVAKVLIEAVPAGDARDKFIMTRNDFNGPSVQDTALTALHQAAIAGHVVIPF